MTSRSRRTIFPRPHHSSVIGAARKPLPSSENERPGDFGWTPSPGIGGDHKIKESEVSLTTFREKNSGELFVLTSTLLSELREMKHFSAESHARVRISPCKMQTSGGIGPPFSFCISWLHFFRSACHVNAFKPRENKRTLRFFRFRHFEYRPPVQFSC